MKSRPKVIAFDVMETLFPLDPLGQRWRPLGMSEEAVTIWFARLIRNALALDATGIYQPFAEVARTTLATLLAEHDRPASATALETALAGLAELPAHPEVSPALQMLHDARIRIFALTNGSAANTRRLLETSGLTRFFERIISIDEVHRWKPAAAVYAHATEVAEVAPHEMALVAVHAWDTHGAKRAGLATGWVSRLEKEFHPLMNPPDVTGNTLSEVCQQLLSEKAI